MKVLLLIFCGTLSLFAEMSEKQRQILNPHIGTIENAIPILEKEIKTSKEKYREVSLSLRSTRAKLNSETSFFQKNVLKAKLKYYEQQSSSYESKIIQREVDLSVYYCVLQAFERNISSKKVLFAKKYLPQMNKRIKKIHIQQEGVTARQRKAELRKKEIPGKQKEAQKLIDELSKQLKVLEYKKSWNNLAERTSITGKISFQKGMQAKLGAESIVVEKVIEDCIKEHQALLTQLTELEVAISQLRE